MAKKSTPADYLLRLSNMLATQIPPPTTYSCWAKGDYPKIDSVIFPSALTRTPYLTRRRRARSLPSTCPRPHPAFSSGRRCLRGPPKHGGHAPGGHPPARRWCCLWRGHPRRRRPCPALRCCPGPLGAVVHPQPNLPGAALLCLGGSICWVKQLHKHQSRTQAKVVFIS
jgi:hypothetical protein